MKRYQRHLQPIWLILLLVYGCAGHDPVRKAESLVAAGHYEEGMTQLKITESLNGDYAKDAHVAVLRNRSIVAERINRDVRAAVEAEQFDQAEQLYQRLLDVDPDSESARTGLMQFQAMRDRSARLAKAADMLQINDWTGAENIIREILLEAPQDQKAMTLMAQMNERREKSSPMNPELGQEFKKVISLEFREANLIAVFNAIRSASGVNFILDRDVRNDAKVSIFVKDVSVSEAVDALLVTQQLAKKVVSDKTLFIYPKTPQKVSEYQEQVVRNFFLSHASAKEIQSLLKTILKTKNLYVDEKRNLIVVRDSQEGIVLAEKLISTHDQADPEVMLALDVVEITRSKLDELGITYANQIALGVDNPLTLQALRNLNSEGISVGFGGFGSGTSSGVSTVANVNLTKNAGDTQLLANPRIRVRNREKAKIHIGDRLPVVTDAISTVSTFSSQTVNYLDVGLKLEVEPQVMLDNDVIIKLSLEVSSATQSKVNPKFYDVGTRNTATTLTIKDGETQILAGLIRDNSSESTSKLPGFGDIPLLGRLFSSEKQTQDKTEIILAITPRVIRNLIRPKADLAEYGVGTESGSISAGLMPTGAVPRTAIPPSSRPPVQQGRPFNASSVQQGIPTPAPHDQENTFDAPFEQQATPFSSLPSSPVPAPPQPQSVVIPPADVGNAESDTP